MTSMLCGVYALSCLISSAYHACSVAGLAGGIAIVMQTLQFSIIVIKIKLQAYFKGVSPVLWSREGLSPGA